MPTQIQIDDTALVELLGLAFTICAAILGFFWKILSKITEDVAILKTKIDPIWDFVMKEVPKLLHSDMNEMGLDFYIDRWNDGTITLEQLKIFRDKLLQIVRTHTSPDKYAIYAPMMVWAVNARIIEIEGKKQSKT